MKRPLSLTFLTALFLSCATAPLSVAGDEPHGLTGELIIKETQTVPEDKAEQAYRVFLETLKKANQETQATSRPLGAPPALEVFFTFRLHNKGKEAVKIIFGRDDSALGLKLEGPGAVSLDHRVVQTKEGRPGVPVTIGPGEFLDMPFKQLKGGTFDRPSETRHYWTEPGAYTLTATYRGKFNDKFQSTFQTKPVQAKVTVEIGPATVAVPKD